MSRVALLLVALVAGLLIPVSSAAAQASPGGGGEYSPVAPFRVLDTRPGAGNRGFVGPVVGLQPRTAQVAGVPGSGIPATGVLAVAMNVTVASPTASAFLTVWPAGVGMPTASNLNFLPGQVVPNLVVSGVGPGGQVGLYINAGTAHVVIDVVGWYGVSGSGTRGARLIPTSPQRIMDTRTGSRTPVGPGQSAFVPVRGQGGVPNSGNVTGVILNVTATEPTNSTFVTVYPDDIAPPVASNLNLVAGQTRPNLVMSKLGASGGVRLYNFYGAVHLVVDVVGYYQTGAAANTFAGRVIPLSAPFRAFDTRDYGTRLGPNQREAWNFEPFVSSLTSGGSPVGPISGLIMNVTSTAVSANTYLTMFPDNVGAVPYASNLNPVAGQNIPNLAVVPVARSGRVNYVGAYNFTGFLHYLADVTAVILSD